MQQHHDGAQRDQSRPIRRGCRRPASAAGAGRRRRPGLKVGPVAKRLGETTVRMLDYNGSIPGPPSCSRPC
jgi:hypothetical protein